MKKTTFALIGTGIVGERIINQIKSSVNSEIISIFDENTERLQEIAEKYHLPFVQTLEELLQTKPDWVYIGTPPISHASLAEKIADYGLNILSEKPLAHNIKDGEKMVKAAREAGIHTAMHFPLMYSPVVNQLKQSVRDGSLGHIRGIELHTYFPHWPRKWQQNPWIASREQGGFIREVFPHYLQLLNHMFGSFTISSHITNYPEDSSLCEMGVSALGMTDSGVPVLLNGLAGMGQKELLEFKVLGTEKVMTIKNWSELWVSEIDEEAVQVVPDNEPIGLIEACHELIHNGEPLIIPFEEGLIVQKWIDELLE